MTTTRPTIKVLAAGFAIFAVIVLFFSLPFYLQQRNVVRNWIRAEAEVAGIRSTAVRLRSGKLRFDVEYQLAFVANGERVVVPVQTSKRNSDVQQGLDRFPAGRRVPIAYNPAAPTEIQIEPGYTARFFAVPLFISGIGLLLAVTAAICWMISSRPKSRTPGDQTLVTRRHA